MKNKKLTYQDQMVSVSTFPPDLKKSMDILVANLFSTEPTKTQKLFKQDLREPPKEE